MAKQQIYKMLHEGVQQHEPNQGVMKVAEISKLAPYLHTRCGSCTLLLPYTAVGSCLIYIETLAVGPCLIYIYI
jgi:aerobic-type carbon monoxide dehydrogenase small subunit (CoxS/CutS family)